MQNVTCSTVVIDGVVLQKQVDNNPDSVSKQFMVSEQIEKKIGFYISSSANSTIGKGKRSGSFARAKTMQGVRR